MSELDPHRTGILEDMTLEDVRQFNTQVVVLGIGSTEPHGPHLPYGTDSFFIDAFCKRAVLAANGRGGRVILYPTIRLSNNVNFKAFPFAGRIGVRTLMLVLLDIIEALEEDGIRKIVLVNGHGGNEVLAGVLREHVGRRPVGQGAFVSLVQSWAMIPRQVQSTIEHSSDHAGEAETSCIMHLHPELVRTDKLADFPRREPVFAHLRNGSAQGIRPWHVYLPESAGGETRKSSPEKGKALIESGADNLAQYLLELSQTPWHPEFPFPTSG